MASGMAEQVSAFRRFNRTWTRLIGTLNEGLHSTPYSLAEARVIYELATQSAPNATEVANALGMDAGYLSRILTRFGSAGLIRRRISKQDGRSSGISLTRKGKSAFETLSAHSDEQARGMLEGLSLSDREQLIGSMKWMERTLAKEEAESPPYVLRPPRSGDMGWVVQSEALFYAEEYGFDTFFEALVARIVADFVTNFNPKRERCWIAELAGRLVGHVFLVQHPEREDTAKLRLLLVEPSARGKGLGAALVNECIRFARACGYRTITLWTQSILTAAHRIYAGAGFLLVEEEAHHSFGQDLIGQTWEMDLRKAAPE
jgi:DNA-binding MarR family transcriptional regulator/N-acetylglutamate synthase-like GNAT family acetyltransferase